MITARQMPLGFAAPDTPVVVTGLAGCADMKRRLADLGILIGAQIRLVRSAASGPLLVGVGTARVAVGQDMARKILVAPLEMASAGRA